MLEIHEARDDQFGAWCDLRRRAQELGATTPEEVAFWRSLPHDETYLLAWRDGAPVGAAFVCRELSDLDGPQGEGGVYVPPELRGQGIGGALLRAGRDRLRELGKRLWIAEAFDGDEHTLRFLTSRGFAESARSQLISLDLTSWEPPGWPVPAGVTLTDLARRPDLARGVHEVAVEAVPDIPLRGPEPEEAGTFETFEQVLGKPGLDPSLTIVALEGDEVIGYAMLNRSLVTPETAIHWLTAVRRAWRGRGVARAMKQAQLLAARRAGIRVVRADNDLRNVAMRRINDALGYVREPDEIAFLAELAAIPD